MKLNLEGNKNRADNDRTNLLFNPSRLWKENIGVGNWPWPSETIKAPSGTKPYFHRPTPHGAGWIDWSLEGNQWLHSPEFRKKYVATFREAWSTELAQAVRTQLVPGYQHETITKGRVLQQECRADGVYNPNGVNLYAYQ